MPEYTIPPSLVAARQEVRMLRQKVIHHLTQYEKSHADLAHSERRLIQLELDVLSPAQIEQVAHG